MATVQSLINRSLRLIGAIEPGEDPTAQESADGLTALNDMISSWQTERLVVFAYADTGFPLVSGVGSYTVGPSGNFNLDPRPFKLENCFVKASAIDYPVEVVDQERWFAIPDKTVQSDIPTMAYYEPELPTGTLSVWPVPNEANSLHIVTWIPVSEFAALTDNVTLPQGYNRALTYNLSIEIAAEYKLPVPDTVQRVAMESLAMLKRANQREMKAYTELGMLLNQRRSDIYSGGYA